MTVFQCLSPENVIRLLSSFITETPIVLVSSQWSTLMDVAETLCGLIYPFVYQG